MDSFQNPFLEEKKQKRKNILIDVLQSIAIAISISLVLYVFIVTPNEVDGPSMLPNYTTGDLVFTSKLHQWFDGTPFGQSIGLSYNRGDVVVFKHPDQPKDFIKRIVGMPGDTIRIENGSYYINGERQDELFPILNKQKRDGGFLQDDGPAVTLKDDEYFVSGDNRDVSYDSRELGPIRREWMKGKVILRFWPLDRFSSIGSGEFENVQVNF